MIRVFAKQRVGQHILISDEKLHHLKRVLRVKNSESIECVLNDQIYQCYFEDEHLSIHKIITIKTEKKKLSLLCGITAQTAIEYVLEKCTELGVAEFTFFKAQYSNAISYEKLLTAKKIERFDKIILAAAEQSLQLKLPKLSFTNSLQAALLAHQGQKGYFGKPRSLLFTPDYKKILQITCDCAEHILVIGPEGGLDQTEELLCNNSGLVPVSIGKGILRVETACVSLVAVHTFLSEQN